MKTPAIPAPAHQATHRHRGDSRCPSGNSSSTNVQGTRMNGIHESVPYQAASSPSQREPPEPPATQASAYEPASVPSPVATPTPRNSQPVALPGWRLATSTPTAVNTTARAEVKRPLPAVTPEIDQPATSSPSASSPRPRAIQVVVLDGIGRQSPSPASGLRYEAARSSGSSPSAGSAAGRPRSRRQALNAATIAATQAAPST